MGHTGHGGNQGGYGGNQGGDGGGGDNDYDGLAEARRRYFYYLPIPRLSN